MRKIPNKISEQQRITLYATLDFYGDGLPKKERPSVRQLAIYLMGRRKGIKLTDQQKDDMWYIRENIKDKVYTDSLLESPPRTLKLLIRGRVM